MLHEVFSLLLSVALLSLQLSQTCSGQSEDPIGLQPDITTGVDYDMEDKFTTVKTEPSPTGDRMVPDSPSEKTRPTPRVEVCTLEYIENCTVLDPLPPKPTLTDVNLARQRGICFAACASVYLTNLMPTLDKEVLPGYRLWTPATKSFILSNTDGLTTDCLEGGSSDYNGCDITGGCDRYGRAYRKILDCERGCRLRLREPEKPSGTCAGDLDCRTDCRQNPETGCGGILFGGKCFGSTFPPCGLDCNKQQCQDGCGLIGNVNDPEEYPEEANPLLPPDVQLVASSTERYFINITETIPSSSRRLGFSTLIVRVEDISQPCNPPEPVYFVLDEGYEFNLEAFSCRSVNISYAVATDRSNMSAFSPPVTVNVGEGATELFPNQLSTFKHSVRPDPDTFQYHIIELQWEQQDRADGYTITLTSSVFRCGVFHVTIPDPSVTNYTIRNTEPYNPNNPVPPLTECTYTATVKVTPFSPDSGKPVTVKTIHTLTYPTPESSDITLYCSREVNTQTGNSYDLTISVELSDKFTPAVRTAISDFKIDLSIYNLLESPARLGVFTGLSDDRLRINSTFFQSERTLFKIRALTKDKQFVLSIYAFWNPGPVPMARPLFAVCFLRDVGPVRPGNVTVIEHQFVREPQEFYLTGERRVSVMVNVTWESPVLVGAGITFYEVRLDTAPKRLDDISPSTDEHTVTQKPGNGLSVLLDFIYNNVPAGTFILYLQIRAGIGVNDPGFWSEPIEVNVTVFDPPPPATMGDDDFNVTSVNYRIDHSNQMVEVMFTAQFTSPMVTFGKVDSYDLWVGDGALAIDETSISITKIPADENRDVQTFKGRSVRLDLAKFRAGANIFIQMRAQTMFLGSSETRLGNWSEAEVLELIRISAPMGLDFITTPSFNSRDDDDDEIEISFTMTLEWSPPPFRKKCQASSTSTMITKYQIAAGTEPIQGPFGEVPTDTAREDFSESQTSGQFSNSLRFDSNESLSNLTLFVQIRVATDLTPDGSWSEPISFPIMLPKPPRTLT